MTFLSLTKLLLYFFIVIYREYNIKIGKNEENKCASKRWKVYIFNELSILLLFQRQLPLMYLKIPSSTISMFMLHRPFNVCKQYEVLFSVDDDNVIMNANLDSYKNEILNENNNHQFPRDII